LRVTGPQEKQIRNSDKKTLELLAMHCRADSIAGNFVRQRLAQLRHEELMRPWYRTGLGWIAFSALVSSMVAIAIALRRR